MKNDSTLRERRARRNRRSGSQFGVWIACAVAAAVAVIAYLVIDSERRADASVDRNAPYYAEGCPTYNRHATRWQRRFDAYRDAGRPMTGDVSFIIERTASALGHMRLAEARGESLSPMLDELERNETHWNNVVR